MAFFLRQELRDGKFARERLVTSNLRLVASIARSMHLLWISKAYTWQPNAAASWMWPVTGRAMAMVSQSRKRGSK